MLLLLGAGMAQGCTLGQHRPPAVVHTIAPLVISQSDGGFVIRAAAPRMAAPAGAASPVVTGAIPLGSDVRIDLRTLIPTQHKETPNGETR